MKLYAALALLLVLAAPLAAGHAEPLRASPGWNERLQESPEVVEVTFTEPVHEAGSWLRVRNLDGERVDLDDLTIENGPEPIMRIGLPPLPDGGYLIRWQTYSQSDGHTVGGAIGFSVGGVAPPESEPLSNGVSPWAVLARALSYLGYTAAIGAIAWHALVARQPLAAGSNLLDRGLLVGAAAHLVGVIILLFDTAVATGVGWGPFLAGEGGRALLVRALFATGIAGLSLLWLVGPVRPRIRNMVLAIGWVIAIALGAALGHAEGPAARAIQIVHALSIAAWVGGLAMLVVWLRSSHEANEDIALHGQRFGTLGMIAVPLMAVTGFYLAAAIIGSSILSPSTWLDGGWRRVLLAKLAIVLLMLGLAAVNRYLILDPPDRLKALSQRLLPNWPSRRKLRWVTGAEAVLGVGVVVLGGALMSLSAPVDALEPTESVFEQTAEGFDTIGTLRISPEPTAGVLHSARLYLVTFDNEPIRDNSCAEGRTDCVVLRWYLDAEGSDTAQQAIGVPQGDGWWYFDDLLFTQAGNHTLLVQVSSSSVYQDELRYGVQALMASG